MQKLAPLTELQHLTVIINSKQQCWSMANIKKQSIQLLFKTKKVAFRQLFLMIYITQASIFA